MQYFRKLIEHKKLAGVLLFGLLLRSLIATGFMLDASPNDGSLFTITVCEGPAGINAIAGLSEKTENHAHHHHEQTNDKHDHAIIEDHGFSACSFWSASGQSLATTQYPFDVTDVQRRDEIIVYHRQLFRQYTNNARFARAPPLFLS